MKKVVYVALFHDGQELEVEGYSRKATIAHIIGAAGVAPDRTLRFTVSAAVKFPEEIEARADQIRIFDRPRGGTCLMTVIGPE